MKTTRLDRRLVGLGLGSRTEVAKLIRHGRVLVDGAAVCRPEAQIGTAAALAVDGMPIEEEAPVLLYHKPPGVLVTMDDPWGRLTVAGALGPLLARGLRPVGRLDADSSGLLLFATDGQLIQRLLHPKRAVEKEYVATVEGVPGPDLRQRLAAGVETAEGVHVATLVEAGESTVQLVVTEGKHRMVRRMLANLGLPVVRLVRIRIGQLELGGMAEGETRFPTGAETDWLDGLR